MSTPKNDVPGASYAVKVGVDNLRYAQELLAENARLRGLVGSLHHERLQLVERIQTTDHLLQEHQAMRSVVDLLLREKQQLNDELVQLKKDVAGGETVRLQQQLQEMETANARFSREFVEVERRNNDLLNLYVASYRLHGTVDRAEVIASIQEIVANLVGCEEHGIFEVGPDGRALLLVGWSGIDPQAWASVAMGEGPVGSVAAAGETFVAPEAAVAELDTPALTACIPLKLDGAVTGAIALFRMLPQKPALAEVDHELFDLLATHAATALYCTRLHAAAGSGR